MLKSDSSETPACLYAHFAQFAPLLHDRRIILRAYQDNYILEILSCRTNECNPANVDLLLGLGEGCGRAIDCFGEGIQIDDNNIDGRDIICLQFFHVPRHVTTGQNTT